MLAPKVQGASCTKAGNTYISAETPLHFTRLSCGDRFKRSPFMSMKIARL